MPKEKINSTFNDEIFFILEGEITEFHVAATTVNLLNKIEKNLEEKILVGGITAAINGMHGVLANSAMLSLYDGEDMYNFAGLVNGKVVCGVFSDADKIKDGDIVKLVVTERDDVLHVHSLVRLKDSLFMMPLNAYCGERAFFWECMKVARNMTFFMWIFASAAIFFSVDVSPENKEYLIKVYGAIFILPIIFCFPFEYWSFRTMRDYSIYASKIFSVYGFPRPDDFDMLRGVNFFKEKNYGFVGYSCELALKKHREKFRLSNI